MLQLKLSNRFERLEDALLDAMATPPASPFAREEIIVPSAAIRRRIELAAADRFGICANVGFSFLAQWLWRQIGHVVEVSEVSPFTTPVLTWRIFGIFAEKGFVDAHPPLAGYLRRAEDDADEVMRYELAGRTAALLEHYLTYRPDWLAAWLAGKSAGIANLDATQAADERWQAELWRRIASDLGTGSRHPSVVFFDAMKEMGPDAPARAGLPESAHIFCLPTTPPLYLDILHRLARWIDLRLYVLNPCREYWFEIVDPKRLAYLLAEQRADHHEVGNRLLSAWGKQTQAHIDLLLRDDSAAVVDDAAFAPSEGDTLLARLQDAVLDLTDLARGSVAIAEGDRSIEVHVCHSLTRELEVLQDRLLALFAGPHPPRPSDILVVTPDLEAAAPLIDAVFGNVPKARAMPYTITGRPASALNPCARALLSVLALATSRFKASAVFELLQQPIIARRFGIGAAELETLHAWVRDSGIRWGIDGEHRGKLGLPALDRHSFSDGLDRLFLGYALPASLAVPLCSRLPAGNPEGSQALALGSFRAFVRQLERLHDELAEAKKPEAWKQTLLRVIDDFVAPMGDEIDDERETVARIDELHRNMADGELRETLPVDVVRVALQALLDDPTRGGVPGGAVTFASMASLRNLPYRFVAAIGLNDGAFPSTRRASEFDLMARAPRRGDRQRRTDERNVFLDLVVAARDLLHLSYTGKSVRDNSTLPPSVLVAELIEYCGAAIERAPFCAESLDKARARLVVEHPLQPFSLDYFEPHADPRRRSFNVEYCDALRGRLAAAAFDSASPAVPSKGTLEPAPQGDDFADDEADDGNAAWDPQQAFFPVPLPKAGAEFREVTLESLERFFGNPCRYLLKERLGIVLPQGDEELDDDEPFVPDWSARDALALRVLPRMLAGESGAALREFARAGVEYPAGRQGDSELAQELHRLETFARRLAPALDEPKLDAVRATLEFDIDGERWSLTGAFGDLRRSGLVRYRYDEARARDYLEGWLEHLFLNAVAPPDVTTRTTWHSCDGHYVIPAIADARGQLDALLRLYRHGLHRPLRFYPKSAWAYVSGGDSLSKAKSAWESTRDRPYGEDRNPAYGLALRGIDDPLGEEFAASAATVFRPLLDIIDDRRIGKPARDGKSA